MERQEWGKGTGRWRAKMEKDSRKERGARAMPREEAEERLQQETKRLKDMTKSLCT